MPFLDYIEVSCSACFGGEDSQSDAVASPINRVFRAHEDVVLFLADRELHCIRGMVAIFVIGLDLDRFGVGTRFKPHDGDALGIGGGSLITDSSGPDFHFGAGRLSIRIRSENEELIFEIRNKCAALGNCGDDERRFADRNRFASSFRVAGRIFHRRIN